MALKKLAIWGGGLTAVLAICVVGAILGLQIAKELVLVLRIEDQPLTVRLPTERLPVQAEVENVVTIDLDGIIETVVPFGEDLRIPFKGEYDFDIEIDTMVPVEFEVSYKGTVPVDTMADISAITSIDFGNVKKLRNLEFETAIPMKFDLPVDLNVPVKDFIRFRYKGPIKVYADEELNVRLDTEFPVALRVTQTVTTPIRSTIQMDARFADATLNAEITEADIRPRLSTLKLETKD